jgi:signal peptidase I
VQIPVPAPQGTQSGQSSPAAPDGDQVSLHKPGPRYPEFSPSLPIRPPTDVPSPAADVPAAAEPPVAAEAPGDQADATDGSGDAAAETAAIPRKGGAHRSATPGRPDSRWAALRAGRAEKKQAKAQKPHRKAPWWELPALVGLAILIAILVKSFVIQPFYIPSESMEKTLHGCQGCAGDRILVNKLIYDFRDPHPGDIVVFHAPTGWDDEPTSKPPSNPILRLVRGFGQLIGFVPPDGQVLVKRVIATGGQTVQGDAQGHVQISNTGPNGPWRTLNEPYVFVDQNSEGTQRPFGPVTVPKGRLWVMGDHRNDSADSRYHCGANGTDATNDLNCDPISSTVPVSAVIGKAFVIAWPPSRWRTLGTPSTFTGAAAAGAVDVPGLVASGVILPVFITRRRRRR